MTVCNMSIEADVRAGMISPDDVTIDYLRGRPLAPRGEDWTRSEEDWRSSATDPNARFDRRVEIDALNLEPVITWGVHPGTAVPVSGRPRHRPAGADVMTQTQDQTSHSPPRFTVLESPIAPLPLEHVDTDQIILAEFLKITVREGLGRGLFASWRGQTSAASGADEPFVLDDPRFDGAQILVAGENFGCGSSRDQQG